MPKYSITERIARALLRLRNRHFFYLDFVLLALIPFVALWLRTDSAYEEWVLISPLIVYTVVTLPIWMGVFYWGGLYRRNWQYASVEELGSILKAVVIATVFNVLVFFLLRATQVIPADFPRSIPFIVSLLVLIAVGGSRFSVRYMERLRQQRQFQGRAHKHVLVFGAGEAGAMIVRELQSNPQLGLNPVAFLDDDERKHQTFILGVKVVGGRRMIEAAMRSYHAKDIIIAMPSAPGKTIREVAAECIKHGMMVKTLPGMYKLLDGTVKVNTLRDIEIGDLLRREPVATETTAVVAMLGGKRVLVTGAGGSIGSELCRQIARSAPAVVVLLGHGENSIFYVSQELRAAFSNVRFESVIADVRDASRINALMERHQPELVFHAAAHKHVTLMEQNIEDAVSNNVVGTRVLADAACAHGVETFVMISSDKAVNPVSVMGATKRVAELYVHARALEMGRRYVAVRFGNVLGSRGSVVPIFKQQIAQGGPVKVTHPEVRRFFMTIPEAVQLVLQAATIGKGGEIFALDMGEPIRIVDLARDMIRLSGLQEGRDIDIEFTGLGPGEKLYEELFVPEESYQKTLREKIFVARNGVKPTSDVHARLYSAIDELAKLAQEGNSVAVRAQLGVIVPEFHATTATVG
ncbi:MAG: polysaccharide biosynthesis protein [Anaerolineae bacterium]|nr:polysaccharide biosynthesis protein [Anaerolineae bacterium]